MQVLIKVDSSDIISTVKWAVWPKVATGLCPLGHVHSLGILILRYLSIGIGILHSEIFTHLSDLPLGIRDIY